MTTPDSSANPPAELAVGLGHLRAARDAAARSSESSQTCWTRLSAALEQGSDSTDDRRQLDHALAAQTYAWAVYHCAVDEVRATQD